MINILSSTLRRTVALLLGGLTLTVGIAPAFAQDTIDRASTLVLGGDISDLITLDPGAAYEFSSATILNNIYDTLIAYEGNRLRIPRPRLATRWTIMPTDTGHRITFRLRAARFASGRPVTAADVVYSYNRVMLLKGPPSFLLTDVAGLKVGSVTALDSRTVAFDLPKTANPNVVLSLLTNSVGGIVDSVEVKAHEKNGDFGSAWLKENSAGSGPYKLVQWSPNNQVVLEQNFNSFRRSVELKRVVMRQIKEVNPQQEGLANGELDVALNFTPEAYRAALGNRNLNASKSDSFALIYLGMRSNKGSPFEDSRVRQAVRHAINQDALINDILGGVGLKTQTFIPQGLNGSDETIYFPYDVSKAKALMKAAGKENGFSVDYHVSNGICSSGVPCLAFANKIQADLAKINIKINIKPILQSELLTNYRAQKLDIVQAIYISDYPDPDANATPFADYTAKSLAWRNQWNNPEAVKLTQAASAESDMRKRNELYKQLTALVAKEGPYAMLYQAANPTITISSISGFNRNAVNDIQFERVSKR